MPRRRKTIASARDVQRRWGAGLKYSSGARGELIEAIANELGYTPRWIYELIRMPLEPPAREVPRLRSCEPEVAKRAIRWWYSEFGEYPRPMDWAKSQLKRRSREGYPTAAARLERLERGWRDEHGNGRRFPSGYSRHLDLNRLVAEVQAEAQPRVRAQHLRRHGRRVSGPAQERLWQARSDEVRRRAGARRRATREAARTSQQAKLARSNGRHRRAGT
jgi:hypothetical protein